VRGRIAEASGDLAGAIAAYEAAIRLEDQLNYDEPPDWIHPVRETLGAALLRAGRRAEARKVFEADLRVNVDNPRSLWALGRTAEYRRRWKGAPLTLADF